MSLAFENLEGVILLEATLAGADRDTTGKLVFDTGAGFLGLSKEVARALGVFDRELDAGAIELAERPLRRLTLAGMQLDQVTPMLVLDVRAVQQVTDRAVLGLAGTRLLVGRAAWIDYRSRKLVVVPSPRPQATDSTARPATSAGAPEASLADAVARSRRALGSLLGPRATPLGFAVEGDGKILIKAHAGGIPTSRRDAWLTLILDTGATKTVLFESALRQDVPEHTKWKTATGLSAPTLLGSADARLILVPRLTLGSYPSAETGSEKPRSADAPTRAGDEDKERGTTPDDARAARRATADSSRSRAAPTDALEPRASDATVAHAEIDCIAIESELQGVLTRAVEQPVAGLLGYSFLRHYRVGLDFGNRVAWFEPYPTEWDPHPFEYVHVGLQLERRAGRIVVSGVIAGSPADRAGIAVGDRVVSVDGAAAAKLSVLQASRRLEGRAGTRVAIVLRRDEKTRTVVLTRRRVL